MDVFPRFFQFSVDSLCFGGTSPWFQSTSLAGWEGAKKSGVSLGPLKGELPGVAVHPMAVPHGNLHSARLWSLVSAAFYSCLTEKICGAGTGGSWQGGAKGLMRAASQPSICPESCWKILGFSKLGTPQMDGWFLTKNDFGWFEGAPIFWETSVYFLSDVFWVQFVFSWSVCHSREWSTSDLARQPS